MILPALKLDAIKNKFKGKSINKRTLIIAVVALLLLTTGIIYAAFFQNDTPTIQTTEFATLNASYFSSTVSATGTVSAENDVQVYTTQTAPVRKILVKENDVVQQGQVLAYLDDKNLRDQIAVKEAAAGVSARTAATQVESARNKYYAGVRALQNGTNSVLVSAQNAVESAFHSWQAAEKTYDDFKRSVDEGYNSQLSGAGGTSDTINQATRNAQLTYDQALSQQQQTEQDLQQAISDISRYDSLRASLRNQLNDLQSQLSAAQRDLATEQGHDSTLTGLEQQLVAAEAARDVARDNMPMDPRGYMAETDPLYTKYLEAYLAAQSSVTSAQAQVDSLRIQIAEAKSSNVDSAANKVDALNRQISDVTVSLNQAESDYSKAVASKDTNESALNGRRDAVQSAKLALENALENQRRNAKNNDDTTKSLQDTLSGHRQSADTARNAYDQALRSLRSAQASADEEIISLNDSLNASIASGDDSATQVELANMYKDLQDMTIVAPMSGVVTKISANEGSAGAGSLFTIESLDHLLIETELKEFDVNTVRPGMKVEVKSDATGDKVYYGKVVSISPISKQHAAAAGPGSVTGGGGTSAGTPSANQPTFETIVALEGVPAALKAGMNTRLSIIVSEDQNVYAVPYSAVFDNPKGEKAILVAEPNEGEKDTHTLREIPVTTGLENDLSIVVEGDALKDHQQVLITPEGHQDGEVIRISDTPAPESNTP